MEDRLQKQIELAAPIARVWRALTDAQQFGAWFQVKLDGPFVAGQPVAGQLTYPGYEHLRMEVVVQTLTPTSYFAYTWHPYAIDPKVDYQQEIPTLVEFHLEQQPNGTLLTVTESGFAKLPPERYADVFRMNGHGWEQQLKNIDDYVRRAS